MPWLIIIGCQWAIVHIAWPWNRKSFTSWSLYALISYSALHLKDLLALHHCISSVTVWIYFMSPCGEEPSGSVGKGEGFPNQMLEILPIEAIPRRDLTLPKQVNDVVETSLSTNTAKKPSGPVLTKLLLPHPQLSPIVGAILNTSSSVVLMPACPSVSHQSWASLTAPNSLC